MKPGTAAILALLRSKPQGITALDALDAVGSFRVAARIQELRAEGYSIDTYYLTTPRGKRIAQYVLQEQMRIFG